MANQDNRHHCYLSTLLSVLTDVPGRCHLGKSTDYFWNTQCLGLYGSRNGGARVSVMFWGCICKDGVGTITDVEGNINSAKYMGAAITTSIQS
jgi:hypothetical protein